MDRLRVRCISQLANILAVGTQVSPRRYGVSYSPVEALKDTAELKARPCPPVLLLCGQACHWALQRALLHFCT